MPFYQDKITPRLSPAYDIVTTSVYMDDEKKYALNLGKTKEWYSVTIENFKSWADKSGIPWRAIKPHIDDSMEKARSLWPDALKHLPMDEDHKEKLKAHWLKLQSDFQINSATNNYITQCNKQKAFLFMHINTPFPSKSLSHKI